MKVQDSPASYGAYLLRYWEVRSDLPGEASSWRFSLQRAGTSKRHVFRDLGTLFAYLARELAQEAADATGAAAQVEVDE